MALMMLQFERQAPTLHSVFASCYQCRTIYSTVSLDIHEIHLRLLQATDWLRQVFTPLLFACMAFRHRPTWSSLAQFSLKQTLPAKSRKLDKIVSFGTRYKHYQ